MKKFILLLSIVILGLLNTGSVCAQSVFKLALSSLPGYERNADFRVYYTYLEASGKQARVNLYVQKDGKEWRQTEDRDKTAVSGYFQIRGGDIYDGEGKYNFYAKAWIDGSEMPASATISTVLDWTSPGTVSDFHKEKKDALNYQISWKNPGDGDFEKVYLYRSREKSFKADSGTRVGEVWGGPNEKHQWANGSLEDQNAEYYYAIIAFDHAVNPSGIVTDAPGDVTPGEVLGTASEKQEKEKLLSSGKVQIFPEEEPVPTGELPEEDGILGGGIFTEAGEVQGTKTEKKSSLPWVLGGGSAILLGLVAYLYFRNRKKSVIIE